MPDQNTPGRLLGIDHGQKVIGLAVCDASWIIARPLGLIARTTRQADFAAIAAQVVAQDAVGVVVGIPRTAADFEGTSQAGTARRWATRLAAALSVPVYSWDEALSTFEAALISVEIGDSPARIDDRAAALILQGFIDAQRGKGFPAPITHR